MDVHRLGEVSTALHSSQESVKPCEVTPWLAVISWRISLSHRQYAKPSGRAQEGPWEVTVNQVKEPFSVLASSPLDYLCDW